MQLFTSFMRTLAAPRIRSLAASASLAALVLFCSQAALAQENPDPALQGVSRSFIQANGYPATATLSTRGFNELGGIQIPRSGFDLINDGVAGTLLLPGIRKLPNGTCDGLTDDAFFLVHVAGRPGDADGDGAFSRNTGLCASRRNNLPSPSPKINDGVNAGGVIDAGMLTFGENVRIRLDRDCDTKEDLIFSFSNDPSAATTLRVESDDKTGHAGLNLGGQGVVWEAAVFPGDFYGEPCPTTIDGYYIVRIPNFSQYFAVTGLNPGDFGYRITAGSDDDGLVEDEIAGNVALSEPTLSIEKFPDLALCPNAEGEWTIRVTNNGNVTVNNVVITDALPVGVTLVSVVSGGLVPSGTNGEITFSPFDLAQCESKTLVIRVRANADCEGSSVNTASALGKFSTFCGLTAGQLETRDVFSGFATANFTCKGGPCVNVTCTPDKTAACQGQTINLTVRGTNCSGGPERIVLRVGAQEFACPDPVASGDFCEHVFQVVMPSCTSGTDVTFPSEATATNDCSSTTTVTPNPCSVACKNPNVDVTKDADAEVQPGDQIHFTITVSNPASAGTDLEHVVVTDVLCPEASNPTNFGGTCNAGAPQVVGSTITWPEFNLASGASCTLTFEATAAGTPSTCSVDLNCHNVVSVTAKCGDASDDANASSDTAIPCTPPGLCRFTGGGCLNEDGGNRSHKQSTFGGNVSPAHEGGGPTGNSWEHVYRDGKTILFNWHSPDAHVILCTVVLPGPCSPHANNTKADFVGTGLYSIGPGGRDQEGNMVAYIIDHKEGACNKDRRDEYSITIREGLVIGQGDIVFQTSGEIDCGNLQIHETPARLFGSGTQLPTPDSQVESVALLNTVIPNPFASSMSFAYQVPEEGAAVEIGIYNVAGRLVKTLASGTQAAGRQAVTWDGTDAAGIRMARGMYFLKSVVGGKLNSYRVIFVAR